LGKIKKNEKKPLRYAEANGQYGAKFAETNAMFA
jgi:hypothetical protein